MKRSTVVAALAALLVTGSACFSPLWAEARSDEVRQLKLALPDNLLLLPKLASTRHAVHKPAGEGSYTYHHNAEITHYRGRFYVAWTATRQSEWTPPYQAWVSSSKDANDWTKPMNVAAATDSGYERYVRTRFKIPDDQPVIVNAAPRCWLRTDTRLYLWTLAWLVRRDKSKDWVGRIFWTEDGKRWHEVPYEKLDALEQGSGLLVRTTASNRGFVHLRDGRLLASTMGHVKGGFLAAPTTKDLTGLTGWIGGVIDVGDCKDVGEPVAYQGPDGVLHYTARWGPRIWHCYSTTGGKSWTQLRRQPGFSDSPGNKDFGTFPDGSVWYVGNPKPGSRMELVLGVSRDGWTFDRCYLVRWERIKSVWFSKGKSEDRPGWEYPSALLRNGQLYVAYSRTRDWIEVSKVDLRNVISLKH